MYICIYLYVCVCVCVCVYVFVCLCIFKGKESVISIISIKKINYFGSVRII